MAKLSMKKMPYHYGVKVRCYPSSQQKTIIKRNSDASRFVYNELVGINNELFRLKKVKLPISLVQQRIEQLKQRQKTTKNICEEHIFLYHPDIDSLALANAKQNYAKAWKAFRKVHRSGIPVVRYRVGVGYDDERFRDAGHLHADEHRYHGLHQPASRC